MTCKILGVTKNRSGKKFFLIETDRADQATRRRLPDKTVMETTDKRFAFLLSAAPEMIQALEEVVEFLKGNPDVDDCGCDDPGPCCWCMVRNALAKARGE